VKEILRGYGDKSAGERRNLMEQLAALNDGLGIGALCRIVRFDDSNLLSKQAALLILRQPIGEDAVVKQQYAGQILDELGPSQRTAADWLRTYVESWDDPASKLDAWEAVARREEEVLHQTPEKSSTEIVRDLLRWHADLLDRLGRHEQSLAVVQRTIDLLDGTREQLLETVDWLMQREAWATVQLVAERFSERFDESALLLYRLAEAQWKQDLKELAEQTAERALKVNQDVQQDHIIAAFTLQERGLFPWAEREYRHVLELGPTGSQNDLRARFLLSEMLHDIGRELDAAEVLQGAVDAMDGDQNVEYLVRRIGREPGSIRSRMHYFYAEHRRSQGQRQEQLEHLDRGVEQDPTDADVLIAMFRVADADDAWKKKTREFIEKAAQEFRQQVRAAEQAVAAADNEEVRSIYNRQLAGANNQLAWLISNTEGDFDEALRCSLRSLELRPDTSGYLDTLGRCYFAKGEYEKAIQAQSRAVELEPHSGQIRRQLEFFQKTFESRRDGA